MKRINIVFVILLVFSGIFTFQSCKEEEGTITSFGAFTQPVLVAPANGTFINLAGTTVDLKWSSTDAEGDPQKWDIYFGTSDDPGLVKTGHNSQTYTVTVAIGTEYFWRVVGTDANGIPTRSETWSFEIVDPNAPIDVTLSWATDALKQLGLDLDPRDAANLRLLIRKEDLTSVKTVNTTDFEVYSVFNTLADGKYYIATDLFGTVDAGDFNMPLTLDLELNLYQRGVMDETIPFNQVMTNEYACSSYRVYLGYIVKTGSTYVFTKEVTKPVSPYSAIWYGTDNADFLYDSEVETYMGCSLQIKGLSYGWMSDYWGEVIFKGGTANITIDPATGDVTIPNQFYCRTRWLGAVQLDYYIEGTGTYDATGQYPIMTITYDLIQNGVSMASQDPASDPAFVAHLTQDPNGLKGGKGAAVIKFTRPLVKPAERK
ncbi:MAG: hypothetical protein MUO72_19310 [Bacteroidales bacterium]|nr:hypothetical protein [Bacteroidales bacterium]